MLGRHPCQWMGRGKTQTCRYLLCIPSPCIYVMPQVTTRMYCRYPFKVCLIMASRDSNLLPSSVGLTCSFIYSQVCTLALASMKLGIGSPYMLLSSSISILHRIYIFPVLTNRFFVVPILLSQLSFLVVIVWTSCQASFCL